MYYYKDDTGRPKNRPYFKKLSRTAIKKLLIANKKLIFFHQTQ